MTGPTRRRFVRDLALAGAGVFCLPGIRPASGRTLEAVSFPCPPWNVGEEGADATRGAGTRIVRTVFSRLGEPIRMTLVPMPRMQGLLQQGQRDFTWGIIRAPEREAYLVYSRPIWIAQYVICRMAPVPGVRFIPWTRASDLAGIRLGLARGRSFGVDIRDLAKGITLETPSDERALIPMLLNGRIDAFAMNWQTFLGLRKEYDLTRIIPTPIALPEMTYHIAASRRSEAAPALMPRIDGVIGDLLADGTIAKIFKAEISALRTPSGRGDRPAG